MKTSHRWTAIVAAITLIAAAGLAMQAHSQSETKGTEIPRTAMTVSVTQPTSVNWPVTVTASGSVAAWQEAIIGAQTGGLRVTAIRAEVGDNVRAGQVLAELARDAAEVELRRLEANLASSKASLAQAKGNAERARIAKQGAAISDQSYNEYLNNELAAQATADSSQAQVDAQRIVLNYTRIVAVDDGVITSRSVVLGKVVASGDEMFRMIRKGRLEWQAEIDANQMAKVRPGQSANVTLPSGTVVMGKVRAAAPSLSTTTGRGIVYVSLYPSAAKAGMFINGHIDVGAAPAITVPQAAVVMADGYSYVFELDGTNRVTRRNVKVGRRFSNRVEIIEGIKAEARIVASGGAFLVDGDKVAVASTTEENKQ